MRFLRRCDGWFSATAKGSFGWVRGNVEGKQGRDEQRRRKDAKEGEEENKPDSDRINEINRIKKMNHQGTKAPRSFRTGNMKRGKDGFIRKSGTQERRK
jgi:hypothetical protein